jgi:hypothetical protein
MLSVRVGPPF